MGGVRRGSAASRRPDHESTAPVASQQPVTAFRLAQGLGRLRAEASPAGTLGDRHHGTAVARAVDALVTQAGGGSQARQVCAALRIDLLEALAVLLLLG